MRPIRPSIEIKRFCKNWQRTLLFCVALVIASGISIAPALGQISLFTTPDQTEQQPGLGWNINEMYSCGNILCSRVYVDGIYLFTVTSLPENQLNNGQNYVLSAEERAKDIQNTLNKVIEAKLSYEQELENSGDRPSSNMTPDITPVETQVGALFGQTVVFLPEQLGLVSRKIVTVTELDARYSEKAVPDLAKEWRAIVNQRLETAIAERYNLYQYPLSFLKILAQKLFLTLFISLSVYIVYRLLKAWDRQLRRTLKQLDQTLTMASESTSSEEMKTISPNSPPLSTNPSNSKNSSFDLPGNLGLELLWNQLNITTTQLESIWNALPQMLLKRQTLLRQQRTLVSLIVQLLLALQVLIWFWGAAACVKVYPQTRVYSIFLISVGLLLPLLWSAIITANKLGDFVIEFSLSRWARDSSHLESPASSRYVLRANTYSTALTQLTTFGFMTIGVLSTLSLLGFPPTLLASFGVIAVALTYFSQNTVNDLLNGALILWNDRYAVGDVVNINEIGGLVEKLNLYMTQLRNAEGEAITIPNGSVGIVRNMTKDWSRVNFSITIAYHADLIRAMELIKLTAAKMQQEPNWKTLITDELEMLGVDEISHHGVLIRALIKTQPIKQWEVAREFRKRIKLVFEREGIQIGIPQQSVSIRDRGALFKG